MKIGDVREVQKRKKNERNSEGEDRERGRTGY